ncbi:MAG: response regulator [Candidatus Electryonea clarkiae]|nr:response regulator [Candidatus Electryonea clarkiae]
MKILLIDDDADIRLITKISLEKSGQHEVVLSEGGLESIDMILQELPDLILLDYLMPEIDGPELYEKLRNIPNSRLNEIPVIFLTGKTKDDEIQELLSLGAIGVIKKPFDPLTLLNEIINIISPK